MSWDDLTHEPEKYKENEKLIRIKDLCCFILNKKDGKELIELLKELYFSRPVFIPGSIQGMTGIREGENNLIRQLIEWSKIETKKMR